MYKQIYKTWLVNNRKQQEEASVQQNTVNCIVILIFPTVYTVFNNRKLLKPY